MEENNNIYPIFDRMLTRQDKEELLKQRGVMIWFTGLSGSGKSTIAMLWNANCINADCCVVSWMEITSVQASTIIWAFPKLTG